MGATANNESSKQNHHLRTEAAEATGGGNIYVSSFVDLLCFSVLCLLDLCERLFINMCLVVTCWERTDLFALVCGV